MADPVQISQSGGKNEIPMIEGELGMSFAVLGPEDSQKYIEELKEDYPDKTTQMQEVQDCYHPSYQPRHALDLCLRAILGTTPIASPRTEEIPKEAEKEPDRIWEDLISKGNYAEAERSLKRLVRKIPQWTTPKGYLAFVFMMTGRLPEAKSLLDQAIKLDPTDYFTYKMLAFWDMLQNDVTNALYHALLSVKLQFTGGYSTDDEPLMVVVACKITMRKFDEALILSKKYRELFGENTVLYNTEGVIYLNQGEPDLAKASFEKAISSDKEDYQSYFNLAQCYIALNNYEKAASLDETALSVFLDRKGKKDANFGFTFGSRATELGIQVTLAKLYDELGQSEKAYGHAKRAFEIDPENLEAIDALATSCFELEKWDEAELLAKKILEKDPASAVALLNLARIYANQNRIDEALTLTDEVLVQEPDNVDVMLEKVGLLANSGKVEESLSLLREAIKRKGEESLLHWALGQLSRFTGDTKTAVGELEEAVRLDPDNVRLRGSLAETYLGYDMPDEAWEQIEACEKLAGQTPELVRIKGLFYSQQKKYGPAIENLEKSLALKKDLVIQYNLALAYFESDQPAKALPLINEVVQVASPAPDPEDFLLLGGSYVKLNDQANALKTWDAACRVYPDIAFFHNNRGYALLVMDRVTEAIEEFKLAVKLDPKDDLARNNLQGAEDYLRKKSSGLGEKLSPSYNLYPSQLDHLAPPDITRRIEEAKNADQLLDLANSTRGTAYEIQAMQAAVKMAPDNSDLKRRLGEAYYNNGKFAEACDVCSEVFYLDPTNVAAETCKTMAWAAMGKQKKVEFLPFVNKGYDPDHPPSGIEIIRVK